jgi:hypothetical protein
VRRTFEERLLAKRDNDGGASEAGARTNLQPSSALLRRAGENSVTFAAVTFCVAPLCWLEKRNHNAAYSAASTRSD